MDTITLTVGDFAGPYEVFSAAADLYATDHPSSQPLFAVSTISKYDWAQVR